MDPLSDPHPYPRAVSSQVLTRPELATSEVV